LNNPLDIALDAIDRFGRYTRATVGTRPFGEPDVTYAPLTFEFSDNFTTCENGARSTDDVVEPPETSATNENGSGALLSRVIAAWGSATATMSLLSNRYQRQWRGAIVALNDHKGTLEVTWRDEQSRILFEGVIMGAWERSGEHSGSHALA
jgi:hypothetical protein